MPFTLPEWKLADRPNYKTNVDRLYPYSEVPYVGQCHLNKLGNDSNNDPVTIEHVDYWGEGRIVTQASVSGFPSTYNINHEYQIVSSGPDTGRKIPNRIPVPSYDDCNTSGYIVNDSVSTVTLMRGSINKSCATDIARMIKSENDRVVLYSVETTSTSFANLEEALKKKRTFYCPHYELPNELQGLTDSNCAFLDIETVKDIIYNNIKDGNHTQAVDQIKQIDADGIKDLVSSLLVNRVKNFMSFSYKLWITKGEDIIKKYFPKSFPIIFKQEIVKIVNQKYHQAMKLQVDVDDHNDRLAWGDSNHTNNRARWNILPVWENNSVTFKLYELEYNMYLKLDANVDSYGDRQAWGSNESDEDRHKYYLEPVLNENKVVYFIINYQYKQILKLDVNLDPDCDRRVWGHSGEIENSKRFLWNIERLSTEKKNCPYIEPPSELQGLTLFDTYRTFVDNKTVTKIIYNNIKDGNHTQAVEQIKLIDGDGIKDLVSSLLVNRVNNFMSFSYKLWITKGEDIINKYFPKSFPIIFKQDVVKIVNQKYHQAIKLQVAIDCDNDRPAWGDSDHTNNRACWSILPILENNAVTFKLHNMEYDMFLKLDPNEGSYGDIRAWGSNESGEDRHKYYLEPVLNENEVRYFIINYQYKQCLKLDVNLDCDGDRSVWGHSGETEISKEFLWNIETF